MNTLHVPHTRQSTSPASTALPPSGRPAPNTHTTVVKVVTGVLAPLIVALAVLGGLGSFATVRAMAHPWFGELDWIVPVGMDVGILVLLAWDLLMEYLDLPWPVLRWVAWAYIASTVVVNVIAAGGDVAGSVLHAAMPVLFITVVEGVRHLIRRRVGLAAGTRLERIPTARWVLAPLSTVLLWRRMVLWHITSYRQGLELEQRHLLAVAHLQHRHGRLAWRWRAPLAERLALQRLPAEPVAFQPVPELDKPAAVNLARPSREDSGNMALPDWLDGDLLDAALQVLADARSKGERLNRNDFGARLREQGFSIANERIVELRDIARAQALRTWMNDDTSVFLPVREARE